MTARDRLRETVSASIDRDARTLMPISLTDARKLDALVSACEAIEPAPSGTKLDKAIWDMIDALRALTTEAS